VGQGEAIKKFPSRYKFLVLAEIRTGHFLYRNQKDYRLSPSALWLEKCGRTGRCDLFYTQE
jgi:hypothetical protein